MSDWIFSWIVSTLSTLGLRVAFVCCKRAVQHRSAAARRFVVGSQSLFMLVAILASTWILRRVGSNVSITAVIACVVVTWLAATFLLPGPAMGEKEA